MSKVLTQGIRIRQTRWFVSTHSLPNSREAGSNGRPPRKISDQIPPLSLSLPDMSWPSELKTPSFSGRILTAFGQISESSRGRRVCVTGIQFFQVHQKPCPQVARMAWVTPAVTCPDLISVSSQGADVTAWWMFWQLRRLVELSHDDLSLSLLAAMADLYSSTSILESNRTYIRWYGRGWTSLLG